MKRVLVTGAFGNVGREVVNACDGSFLVRVAQRNDAALPERWRHHERARFDFVEQASWHDALEGCEYLFLLRPPPLGDMDATLKPFIDTAYQRGVAHIVFLSVAGAERMKWVPHRKVELHLQRVSDAWTVLRPGFFAQNLQDAYLRDIVEDGRLYVPAAQGRVAFLDVRDAAQVVAQVLQSPRAFQRKFLTLTGPAALSFDEVSQALSRQLGRNIRYVPATLAGYAWHLWRARNLPWMQVLVQTFLHWGLRRGDAEQVDPTLEAVLGRPPSTLASYVGNAAATWQPLGRKPVTFPPATGE